MDDGDRLEEADQQQGQSCHVVVEKIQEVLSSLKINNNHNMVSGAT